MTFITVYLFKLDLPTLTMLFTALSPTPRLNTVTPRLTRGIRSSKAARSVNPRWTNLILYGINGDTGTRLWKVTNIL
jgi:hypothetical protein